ncbi:hypothetical protein BDL97_12G062100 [Sphagnum fallax]|nr:hypothetical protein BDL97_12G062100 [Sphagnum fallax]
MAAFKDCSRSFPLMHLHRLLQIHPKKRKDRECS